jgi:transposase InsO family protein
MLSEADQERCCEARKRTGWGPRLVASEVGIPHATVHRALKRRGCSRRPREPRAKVVRYEWPCPGNLLHVDTKRHARFTERGHAVTGKRTQRSREAGWEFVHTLVDDCSRLAYSEIHDDERADTSTGSRVAPWTGSWRAGSSPSGCSQTTPGVYVKNKGLAQLLGERGIEHWRTKPYSPQTNGKVERLQQDDGSGVGSWARLSLKRDRRAALPHWLDHYNESCRHSALGNGPPMDRVRDVLGHDI